MRSNNLLDRPSEAPAPPAVRDLLVLWQQPETREFIPIGRFNYDGRTFSFAYTRDTAEIDGFRPLPGLPDLRSQYAQDVMPAVFDQRVMPPTRPDYPSYMSSLGLDAEHATPWEQIVESGGTRNGDTLQSMQVPTVTSGRAEARFLVNGLRWVLARPLIIADPTVQISPSQHEGVLRALNPGDEVTIVAERDNTIDEHASIVSSGGVLLGWVSRPLSARFRGLLVDGPAIATVARVAPPGTPPHLRLILDVNVPAPAGFSFDPTGQWEPLPSIYPGKELPSSHSSALKHPPRLQYQLWQCAWQPRLHGRHLRRADRTRWAGHCDPPRHHPVLHDDSRGVRAGPASQRRGPRR